MPAFVLPDTLNALGGAGLRNCDSRALFADRFADPTSKEEDRKTWFNNLIAIKAAAVSTRNTSGSSWHPPGTILLHARLQARLMVNMAGGVMENAGLSLDRYGLPHIPGSAVKGCARRAALAALREWCETKSKPGGEGNLFTPLCANFTTPAALLTTIARVFGWVGQDWPDQSDRPDQSDLLWASHGDTTLLQEVFTRLGQHQQAAGTIAFLPASPNRDPGLVLDVLTPHHTKYYERKPGYESASDTEEPVPVFFPAVKEQGENDYFTFTLIPLRRSDPAGLAFAKLALRTGLETFGIGAKTNAGYGWFDASEAFQQRIINRQAEALTYQQDQRRKAVEKASQEAEVKAKADAKAAFAAALEGLTPEQQEDKKLELLTDPQFDAKVRAFCKDTKKGGPSEPEKHAIVRALRGPRLSYWQTFKIKATKGDLATVENAIRQLSKALNSALLNFIIVSAPPPEAPPKELACGRRSRWSAAVFDDAGSSGAAFPPG